MKKCPKYVSDLIPEEAYLQGYWDGQKAKRAEIIKMFLDIPILKYLGKAKENTQRSKNDETKRTA